MGRDPVKKTFDQAAGNYDAIRLQIIPKVRELEKLVQTYVVFPKNRDHLENDIAETVEAQLACLKAAGFKTYDLLWRHEKFAAFHARK